ncbi:unnamed protein product [Porites lobata]|uniref:Uncharacterized protein n=1 Tax=Porites lobata TaxID=104759 RepID=A0ABN8QPT2_9CNID|nr:unnamed protein product [Porites lobata]
MRQYCASFTVNKYGYIQKISPVKTAARSRHDWFDFHLQVSPTKVQRVVGFDKTKHPKIKHFQETKSPVLLKNLLIPDDEDNDWLFNQQSYVSQCANADVPFSYVPNFVKSERSESTSQEASDVSLRELKQMAPNKKVNVHATLSMGAQKPNNYRNQIQSSFICQRRLHIGRRNGHNGAPHMGTVIYTTEKQQGLLLLKPHTTVLSRIKIP